VKRSRNSAFVAQPVPICEEVLTSFGGGLSELELCEKMNSFQRRIQAAAPAIVQLKVLTLEVRISAHGDRLVAVAYLRPKPQLALPLWLEPGSRSSRDDPQREARADLDAIRESICTNQSRLDEIAAAARELGAQMLARLDRGQTDLLALLRGYSGKVVDFELPEGDQLRLAFPRNPLAADRQSDPIRLRGLVHSVHRGYVILSSLYRERNGEWTALTGLRDGKLRLTWGCGVTRSSLNVIAAGVLSADSIEVCAALVEKGIPSVPVRALLLEEEQVRQILREVPVRATPRNGAAGEWQRPYDSGGRNRVSDEASRG